MSEIKMVISKLLSTLIYVMKGWLYCWNILLVGLFYLLTLQMYHKLSRIRDMPNCVCSAVTYITSLCGWDDIRLNINNRKFINCRGSTFLPLFTHTTCWIIICCTIGNAVIITICICCTGCGWSTYRVGYKEVISNIDLFALILDVKVPRTLCEVVWWKIQARGNCLIVSIENVIRWKLLIEQKK